MQALSHIPQTLLKNLIGITCLFRKLISQFGFSKLHIILSHQDLEDQSVLFGD